MTVHVREQQGDSADLILLHAGARKVDLIVLGSNPRMGGWLVRPGSMAERVALRATCPTLIVPSVRRHDPGAFFSHILCGADLLPASAAVLEQAVQLATGPLARLTVVHARRGANPKSLVGYACRWITPKHRRLSDREAEVRLQAGIPSALRAAADVQVRVLPGMSRNVIFALRRRDESGFDRVRGK